MIMIGRPDLAQDPSLANNDGRVARVQELDEVIGAWTIQRTVDEVLQALEDVSVPSGRIYTIEDIAKDPHYLARGMLESIELNDGSKVLVPGIVPKLSKTPGQRHRLAPSLGQDSETILKEVGLTDHQIQQLIERGGVKGTS